jgi:hypothetical protein
LFVHAHREKEAARKKGTNMRKSSIRTEKKGNKNQRDNKRSREEIFFLYEIG